MGQLPFIAVEGPIGVGKTSLAKMLSARFDFHLLKEIVEENPFLGKFYDDIEAWSFQTEMFFLCNRYKQLEDVESIYFANNKPVVADYHISKNMIFAKRTLNDRQFAKYAEIFNILVSDMPKPNMVIYLDASLETLLERIKQRGREVEQNIQPGYLRQLTEDYRHFMKEFEKMNPDIPVIRLNGDDIDFVHSQDDLEAIIEQVEHHLKKGELI